MGESIRSFTGEGTSAFSRWLRAGAQGSLPSDLLAEPTFSKVICEAQIPTGRFENRYEFGVSLAKILAGLNPHEISYDRGLWAWLAARFFDQLCPQNSEGKRTLRKEYVYIPNSPRIYYRHLVRTPWYLVATYGEAAKYLLLAAQKDDPAPLSRQSYLLDQLAARQFVIASPTLVDAARSLYTDPHTGLPKRGSGAKGRGSPRRLALIANQLALTYDIREMPVDNFLKLLPSEFSQ